ncbi:hypothetical protein OESDEN_20193, partial [Oesophagostomum dentatum]
LSVFERPKQRKRHISENGDTGHWEEVRTREQLQREWARENEEFSSSENSDDDLDWRLPARKKKKQTRRVREPSSSSEVTSLSAEESEDAASGPDAGTSARSKKLAPKKEKRWDKPELDRLKVIFLQLCEFCSQSLRLL